MINNFLKAYRLDIDDFAESMKGGKGSGHHGHAGRDAQNLRGGSLPRKRKDTDEFNFNGKKIVVETETNINQSGLVSSQRTSTISNKFKPKVWDTGSVSFEVSSTNPNGKDAGNGMKYPYVFAKPIEGSRNKKYKLYLNIDEENFSEVISENREEALRKAKEFVSENS